MLAQFLDSRDSTHLAPSGRTTSRNRILPGQPLKFPGLSEGTIIESALSRKPSSLLKSATILSVSPEFRSRCGAVARCQQAGGQGKVEVGDQQSLLAIGLIAEHRAVRTNDRRSGR